MKKIFNFLKLFRLIPKQKRCVNFNSEFRNSIESDVLKIDWEKVMANKPTSNKLKPFENGGEFYRDTEAIQLLFNNLIEKFDIPQDSFSARWYKNRFVLWIDMDTLRSQSIKSS